MIVPKSIVVTPRIRRHSLGIAVEASLRQPVYSSGLKFEPLEPRILLSADGLLPMPPDVGLLDTISDPDPADNELGALPPDIQAQIPVPVSDSVEPSGASLDNGTPDINQNEIKAFDEEGVDGELNGLEGDEQSASASIASIKYVDPDQVEPGTYLIEFQSENEYEIYDVHGQLLSSGSFDPSNQIINFSGLEITISGDPAQGSILSFTIDGTIDTAMSDPLEFSAADSDTGNSENVVEEEVEEDVEEEILTEEITDTDGDQNYQEFSSQGSSNENAPNNSSETSILEQEEVVEEAPVEIIPNEELDSDKSLQIVFVDTAIEDYESLIAGLNSSGAQVTYIDNEFVNSVEQPSSSDAISPYKYQSGDLYSKNDKEKDESKTSGFIDDDFVTPQSISANNHDDEIIVYFIDSSENGVEKITDSLAGYENIDAVHIISHGAAGMLYLGNTRLSNNTLSKYKDELTDWGDALSENADILLYGCDVAADSNGIKFVENIAEHIGANVSASNDDTGNPDSGGDYELEVAVGEIDTETLFASSHPLDFAGLLAPAQLQFTMASGENSVTVDFDGASISISDGVTTTTDVIGNVSDISITGVNSEDDTLIIDFSANEFFIDIDFDGGAGGNDSLEIVGGTFDSVSYLATGSDAGDITIINDGGGAETSTITYSNLEPVTDTSTAADRVFTGTSGANDIELTNAASAGQSIIQDTVGGTFESITFNNPTNSLTINGGDGDDIISIVGAQDPGLAPTEGITIDGGVGTDDVSVDGGANYKITIFNSETLDVDGGAVTETNLNVAEVLAGLQEIETLATTIEGLGGLDTELPLSNSATFGDLSGFSEIIQQFRTDLAAAAEFDGDPGDMPNRQNLEAFLLSWAPVIVDPTFGNITITTSNVLGTTVEIQGGETLVSNTIDITASRAADIAVDDTDALSEANVSLDGTSRDYSVDVTTDFSFAFGSNVTTPGFIAQFNEMSVGVTGNTIDFEGDVDFGVLGASIDAGSAVFDLDAQIDITFSDPGVNGSHVSSAELTTANVSPENADDLVDIDSTGDFTVTFDFTPDAGFAPGLAGTVQVGGNGVLGNANNYDLFTDFPQGPPVDLVSDDLYGISLLSAQDLLTPLTEFELWLSSLTTSSLYDGNLLLVDNVRVGDLLDFADLLRTHIIDPVVDGASLPDFATVQELVALVDAIDPARMSISFSSGDSTLGISLDLSDDIASFGDFDYNLMLDALSEIETSVAGAQVDIDTSLGLDVLFEFNLDPDDEPVLGPDHAVELSQTGILNGDAEFEITVGGVTKTINLPTDPGNTSLSDLIVDLNAVLDLEFGVSVVVASIDTTLGTSNPRLLLTAAGAINVDDLSRLDSGVLNQNVQFSVDAVFDDGLGMGDTVLVSTTVSVSSDPSNSSLSDLVDDINTALDDVSAFGPGVVTATLDFGSGSPEILLSLDTPLVGEDLITENLDFLIEAQKVENPAVAELGLVVGPFAIDNNGFLNTLPDIDISAGGVDFEFVLEVDGVRTGNLIVDKDDTLGLVNAVDLVPFFDAVLPVGVISHVVDGRLVFTTTDGGTINTLRVLADSGNPIIDVLGFTNGQATGSQQLAPAYFDTTATSIDGTIRTNWSDPGAMGHFGFVEFDFMEAVAQSTVTLHTELIDSIDNEIDLNQLDQDLGEIVSGPVTSGKLSTTPGDPDFVANISLQNVVTIAGDVQFAIFLDGYLSGETQIDDHRLTISATQEVLIGEPFLGFGTDVQELISGGLTSTLLSDGVLSGNAVFTLTVGGDDLIVTVMPEVLNNSSVELLNDINEAIDTAAAGGFAHDINVRLLEDVLIFTDSNDAVIEVSATNAIAQNELMLSDGALVERVIFSDIFANPSISFEGRPRADVSFDVQIDSDPVVNISISQIETQDNFSAVDLDDLLIDVNLALVAAGVSAQVEARVVASRLVLVNVGAADTQLKVSNGSRINTQVSGNSIDIFKSISADTVSNALVEYGVALQQTDFIDEGTGTGPVPFLDVEIPLINQTALEINNYIDAYTVFADDVSSFVGLETIQELEQAINELLGLDHAIVSADADTGFTQAGITFAYGGATDIFGIELVFEQEGETEFDFFVDVFSLASLVDPDIPYQLDDERVVVRDPLGAIELVAESLATIDLSIAVDLSTMPVASVLDNTQIDLEIRVDEDDLNFQAKVGSASLFIQGGSMVVDADGDASTDDFLTISTTFDEFILDGGDIFPGPLNEFEIDLVGAASVEMPLFNNASVTSARQNPDDTGDAAPLILNLVDIADVISEVSGSVEIPDDDEIAELTDLVSSGLNNLLSDPSLLIDGLDNMLSAIQTAIEVPLQGLAQIPLIGDQLGDGVQPFLDQINQVRIDLSQFLLNEYAEATASTGGTYSGDLTLILQEALFDLFAAPGDLGVQLPGEPDGNADGEGPRLGLLQDLPSDGNPNVGFEDILLNTFNDGDGDEGVQYDFHLGQSYSISLPFEIGLGTNDLGIDAFLPGFGFDAGSEEGVTVDVSWDLRIGFGVSIDDLFYISTIHFEDISNGDSDYVEELVLALDVTVPGFEADVSLGLVGAEITDGIEGPASITSLEKITLLNTGLSPGMAGPASVPDIEAGTFDLILHRDVYGASGEFVSTSSTSQSHSIDEYDNVNFVTNATGLIAELATELFGGGPLDDDGILVTPDLSEIDFLNPGIGLTFTAFDPSVTRIEFIHTGGNNFGFGVEDDLGNILNQFEDQRSTGLGFATSQDAVTGVITGMFEAPVDGALNQDIAFTLTVSGTEIEVMVHASNLDEEVDNPDAGLPGEEDTMDGVPALASQLQDAIDLALGEAGFAAGDVEISVSEIGSSGQFNVILEGTNLENITWDNQETSFVSLKFAVDLFGDVLEPGEASPLDPLYEFVDGVNTSLNPLTEENEEPPNLDRPRLTLPELIGSPSTSIYATLEADSELRLHIVTNTNSVDEFVGNIAALPVLGLPSVEFDMRAGLGGTLILFGQVDPDEPADEAFEFEIDDIDFDNIQIDMGELLGNFLGPTLGAISTVLGPVFDIIGDGVNSTVGFLNEPIPIISELASVLGISSSTSWLDLTGNKDSFNQFFGIVQQATDLLGSVNDVLGSAADGTINLGGLRLVMDDESPFYFPDTQTPVPIAVADAYENLSQEEADILQLLGVTASGSPIPEPGGFTFELLETSNIFRLITGDNFDIFSFNLPTLELQLGIDFGFDFDILEFAILGGAAVTVDLGIGYDSTGLDRIRQAREEGVPVDGADLLDGFFIRTIEGGGPELKFEASFSGQGGVDVHTPSFCIDLGFFGSLCFPRFDIFVVQADVNAQFSLAMDLIDPNEDGKLRIDEISSITNGFDDPQNLIFLFDVTASASGSFNIGGTILGTSISASDLGLAPNIGVNFTAADFLSNFGIHGALNPIVAETLTTDDGSPAGASTGVARANVGQFEYAQVHGDTTYAHAANVTISDSGVNNILVTNNSTGSSTTISKTGLHTLVVRGTEHNDFIDASGLTGISLDIRGNGGNDTIIGGQSADIILGGTGEDTISGGGHDDALFGGLGDDNLSGNDGTDFLIGGQGNDILDGNEGADTYLYLTTKEERSGFGQDVINESAVEAAFTTVAQIKKISGIQKEEGSDRIVVTVKDHGLVLPRNIIITGVNGVPNANGASVVVAAIIDDNTFIIDAGRKFTGVFDADNGAGFIIDPGQQDLTRPESFQVLTDTIDLTAATSSQSLQFTMDPSGTKVSFVDETVAINTITHNGFNIETLLGGEGNDLFDISANGNFPAPRPAPSTNFTNLDGGEGADRYIVRIGDGLNADVNIQDTGIKSAIDTFFVFGRDDAAIPDVVGLTDAEILFDVGMASQNSITYSPVVAGNKLDSGLEVIQIDLLNGDDVVFVESTPTESTVTINGGLGSDTFSLGVSAATGAEENLNKIDGTEDNGPLKIFGNNEDPNAVDNPLDLDELKLFDTTDIVDNNAANGDAGLLNFNAATQLGKVEGLGITIAVEFGGMEVLGIQLGEGNDEFTMLGTIDGDRVASGLTTLFGGTGKDKIDVSLTTGGKVEIHGEEGNDLISLLNSASADLFFFGDEGSDEINLTALSALATVAVSGGIANDTINVGSKRSNSDQAMGNLNGIAGTVTSINGDAGLDTLILDDSQDTAGNNAANGDAGTLTQSTITGLGMTSGIDEYLDFEQIYVHTGSGNDEFNVQSTDIDAITLIDTNAGNDVIVVSSGAPLITGNLDGIEGDLVLHGGDGVNSLLISDISTAQADPNVVMDEGDFDPLRPFIRDCGLTPNLGMQNHHFITGLAGQSTVGSPFSTGTIYYAANFDGATGDFHGQDPALGGVTIVAGNQGNHFQIDSLYTNDLTTLFTGDGDDIVALGPLSLVTGTTNPTADGNLLVYGGSGADLIDGSLSTVSINLDGGDDDDILFGGDAEDLLLGGGGNDYLDGGDDNDVLFGDSEVTLDLDAIIVTRVTVDPPGKDFLVGAGGLDEIHGGGASDVLFGDNATATRDPVSGVILSIVSSDPIGGEETFTSSGGPGAADMLFGDAGDDFLVGGLAQDHLEGNEGKDVIFGDNANILFEDAAGMSMALSIESTDTGTGDDDEIFGDTEGETTGEDDIVFGGDGNDAIEGQGGNDILFGDNGTAIFNNGSANANDLLSTAPTDFGADNIMGGSGNDIIVGDHADVTRNSSNIVSLITSTFNTGANDTLEGNSGNDIIIGGLGADQVKGDEGDDIIVADQGVVNIGSGVSNTTNPGLGGDDVIDSGTGNDQVLGGAGADNITTGDGNDTVLGDNGNTNGQTTTSSDPSIGGNDTINTGGGNDQIVAGNGSDNITSGTGNDAILGDNGTTNGSTTTSSNPTTGGNDTIIAGGGNDQVIGGAGNDNINAGSGNDAVLGDNGTTNGSTTQSSNPGVGGNDTILASGGNNQVIGGFGADIINTGNGRDSILGDNGTTNGNTTRSSSPSIGGNDNISAGGGNDQIIAGFGNDRVNAGGGDDMVLGDNGVTTSRSVVSSQSSTGGNDRLFGGSGNDNIIAGFGNDFLDGGSGLDILLGDNGSIVFSSDTIVVKTSSPFTGGNDFIRGGSGNDVLIGGFGSDRFDGSLSEDIIIGDNGIVLIQILPNGERVVVHVDALGNGPLDRSVLFNLFGFDLEKNFNVDTDLSQVESIDGGFFVDTSGKSEFEPRRFLHHNGKGIEVEAEEFKCLPIEEVECNYGEDVETNEKNVLPGEVIIDDQVNEETNEANSILIKEQSASENNNQKVLNYPEHIGAASLALYGWKFNRRSNSLSAGFHNDSEFPNVEEEEIFKQIQSGARNRMSFDFERGIFTAR